MAEVVRMPLLSDTMKEGVIAAWHKKVGDNVKSDDVLADVETDKATMEVMPYVDGTLLYIGVEKGKAAKVNDIIAIIGKQGEDISSLIESKNESAGIVNIEIDSTPTVEQNINLEIPKELTVVRMPLLSDTMKEGKIIAWLKNVGDVVKSDDVLAEVETDKATMEVMGYADGTLLYQGVPAGSAAKVNDVICVIGKAGTDINPYMGAFQTNATVTASKPAPVPTETITNAISEKLSEIKVDSNGRIKASPLAKKIAKEKGININTVKGSGDGGRIIAKDITNAPSTSSSPVANNFVATGTESYTDVPVTQMRKIIAERLSQSKFTAPHFYLTISVQLDNLLNLRKQINESQPVKVSINDMIIKACALSLRKHPDVNTSWLGDVVRYNNHIHIGSAVALPDGLIVPVIKFVDQKSITQIATDANELYDKAKNKKIQPSEFTGNTFTISNLGMMDIDEFTAIVNPPDACILAVGKGAQTPVVVDGKVEIKTVMKLTLSCDHRVVDGAVGASFLQTLKKFLENPIGMFI